MVSLVKAEFGDCSEIHRMQVESFNSLLLKYQDFETSPAAESLERIRDKMKNSDYYFIVLNDKVKIGAIRIIQEEKSCRISPMFILPEYRNNGYAKEALRKAEELFEKVDDWYLDTIKEEPKLCSLYSKMGYKPNGREEKIKDNMTIVFFEKHK